MMPRGITIMRGYEQKEATTGWGVRMCRERALLSTAGYRIWLATYSVANVMNMQMMSKTSSDGQQLRPLFATLSASAKPRPSRSTMPHGSVTAVSQSRQRLRTYPNQTVPKSDVFRCCVGCNRLSKVAFPPEGTVWQCTPTRGVTEACWS